LSKPKATSKPATGSATPTGLLGNNTVSRAIVVVLVLTFLLYLRSLANGITALDDDYYIVKNPYLRDFSLHGIYKIFTSFYSYNYHPFTTLTNLVEYQLAGLNPLPYHVLNLLLHLLNTWLVYRFTLLLGGRKSACALTALLFAVHPAHVESVAWISERKDVLYAAFYLSALIAYIRYRDCGHRSLYFVCLGLFVCSLLSKSAAVTLPLVLLVIDYYKGYEWKGRALAEKIPFLLLSVLFGILAFASQRYGGALQDLSINYSLASRIVILFAGFAAYFMLLVAPVSLAAIHYFPDQLGGALQWYYYLGIPATAAIVWFFLRRGAYRRERIFAFLFFLAAICVMLQIVTVGSAFYSERYTYMAYIGLFFIAAQWVTSLPPGNTRRAVSIVGGVMVTAFFALSWMRIPAWADTDSILSDIVEKNAGKQKLSLLYLYWGNTKKAEGDNRSAYEMYTTAIQCDPGFDLPYIGRAALTKNNRQFAAAIADYSSVIRLKPEVATNYSLRGWVYYEKGDTSAAMSDYDHALKLDPHCAEAANNMGWAYMQKGNDSLALAYFSTAIVSDTAYLKPRFNRVGVYMRTGNLTEALSECNIILARVPTDSVAWFDRGVVRVRQKDTLGAMSDWRKSADLGYPNARNVLNAFAQKK
jgi:protein O-mannosyl-transferase